MSSNRKITIIGGGNGGFAAAADLTIRGNEVTLYEVPSFSTSLNEAIERGGIEMESLPGNGLNGGFAKIHKFTIDIEEALSEPDITFIIVPSYSLDNIANLCAPYLKEGQIIALCPANFGGSIYFKKKLSEYGFHKRVWIAEFACMMYATRKKNPSSVWVRGYKHNLGCAVFPSHNADEIFGRLYDVYPIIKKYNTILETGLSNINTCLHTSLMMFNITNIDNREKRHFYRECFTHSVQNMLTVLDNERLQFNKIEGVNLSSLNDIVKDWYGHQGAQGELVQELMTSNPVFAHSMMPTELNHRYITEDVPFGLIPIEALMEQLGLPHETHTALIRVICTMCNRDFYAEARRLDELGLKGLNAEEMINYLTYGE